MKQPSYPAAKGSAKKKGAFPFGLKPKGKMMPKGKAAPAKMPPFMKK